MHIKKLDLDLIPQMKSQEIRAKRRVLSRTLEGTWTTLLKGRGMEFAGFRKYTYGDDASRIDWGASLRAKDTLVREFEEYRNVNVLFLIDVSDSMLLTSQKKLKAEHAAELAFNLGVSILDNGDSVGFVMFSDEVVAQQMPGVGKHIIYSMANHFSNPKYYGGERDFKNVVSMVNAMLKQKSLIILLSDFVNMPNGWEKYIRMLSERFDLMGIMIRDPRDFEIPNVGSQYLLQDPSTNETIFVDLKQYKKVFEQKAKEEETQIKSLFDASKAGFIKLRTDEGLLDPIVQFFRKRTALVRG